MARQVFVQVADALARDRIERRQAAVQVGIRRGRGLGPLRIPADHAGDRRVQVQRQHRHPGIDEHIGAVVQLPGDAVEQVGPHRQPAVREVDRAHQAVGLRVGVGLQEHGVDLHVHDALHQLAQIAVGLRRIGIVDVVQVHVREAHRGHRLDAGHAIGEVPDRGVVGQQHARRGHEPRHAAGAVFQRQRHLITLFAGDAQRGAALGAIGPDPDARRLAGGAADLFADRGHVAAHALLEAGLVLVAAIARVVLAHGGGRLGIALGIGQRAVVRGVGVGGDLHQAGTRDLAHVVPVQEAVARLHVAAEIDLPVGRRVHPRAHRRQHRRPAVGLEDGQHAGQEAAVAIVEGQQHGALGQRLAAGLARGQDLVHRDGLVAVLAQPVQLVDQPVGAHAEKALVGVFIFHVVVGQRQEMALHPGLVDWGHRPLGGRDVDGDILAQAPRSSVASNSRPANNSRGIEVQAIQFSMAQPRRGRAEPALPVRRGAPEGSA